MEYKTHPLCDLYPDLPQEELEELAADIKSNGVREVIWIYENMILDGKNRMAACKLAGVDPKLKEFPGTKEQAIAFVKSKNLWRRHLSPGQRAAFVAKEATAKEGRKTTASNEAVKTQTQVAQEAGVSRSTIQRAKAATKPKPEPEPKPENKLNPFEQAKIEAERLRQIEREIHRLGAEVLEIAETPIGAHLSKNSLSADINQLKDHIRWGLPHSLCVYCGGDKCKGCLKTGWMTRHELSAAPRDLK